jgi:hypothetical protein
LAGIKLRANRHNGPTGTTFSKFSSLQTLAAILQAEPKNSDSRNAGQARPIEDPALAGKDQVFQDKIKPFIPYFYLFFFRFILKV